MEPWALSDLGLYICAGLALVLKRHGVFQLMILILGALPFYCIRLPLRVFFVYYTKSYDQKLPVARRASPFEYYCIEGTRWFLTHLNGDIMGRSLFFGRGMSSLMFKIRRFRYGIDEVGDSYLEHVSTDLFSGYWVKSRSRADFKNKHDLMVFYSPGNMMGFASSYAYIEFLQVMLVSLIEQGYENPCIFCLDIDWAQGYKDQVNLVGISWEYASCQCPSTVRVMMGDGPGATALLATMLHIANPLKGLIPLIGSTPLRPNCAVFISPLAKIAKMRINNENDWVTNDALGQFALKTILPQESTSIYTMPGLVYSPEWWSKALPEFGTYITYGQEETCGPEIAEMAHNLAKHGKVTVSVEPEQIHAWPLAAIFLGRTKLGRTRGVTTLTGQIAYMTLWQCISS